MEKKNNFVKSIFYVFFAFCFLGTGLSVLSKTNESTSYAQNTTFETVDNSAVPEYFQAQEFFDGSVNNDGLIEYDTFMYYTESGKSSSLELSFSTNGSGETNSIYEYVYYPDLDNLTFFYFYDINSINLLYNGTDININKGNYIVESGQRFTNHNSSMLLNTFKIKFSGDAQEGNNICITETLENGNVVVKEGLYTLSVTYMLYSCLDGRQDTLEENFADSEGLTMHYNFYIVDRDTYLSGGRPNIEYKNFDHTVNVSNLTNPNYAYYLYNNYSSKPEGSSSQENSNKLSYIDYDYTKFEANITKSLSNTKTTQDLLYDLDTSSVVSEGEELVHVEVQSENTARIFFNDVGDYTVTLDAIQVVNYQTEDSGWQLRKFKLYGLTAIAKQIMVYVYGYQASFTNYDLPADENNIRVLTELKSYDYDNTRFTDSADITSQFLNSNADYSQSADKISSTFLQNNIMGFIASGTGIDGEKIVAQKTNQTPVKFVTNATLDTLNSYIFLLTAEEVSGIYTLVDGDVDGKKLYYTNFTGLTDGTVGTYTYVIGYTYKNFYENETNLAANSRKFFQIFHFEIVKELPKISIKTMDESGQYTVNVASDTFVNSDIMIEDLTQDEQYSKDVTIQVYLKDYHTDSYMSKYGGENGISFTTLLSEEETKKVYLSENAQYTVRLYYTSDILANPGIISINSTKGFLREQTFTVDKEQISNIQGRNVTEITGSSDYLTTTTLQNFTTNQSIVISWDRKASGASTFAYYRYFPIIDAQYYSADTGTLSVTLDKMLNSMSSSYLPVNHILNMSTANNNWLLYHGNTLDMYKVSTEYVLSDAGLYLIDVYDEAGNHTVDVFMIDNTKPIFALHEGTEFSLTSLSQYVAKASTLHWANYKAIYIANFNTIEFNSSYNPTNITEADLNGYEVYKTWEHKISTDIFSVLYNKLFQKDYMQMLECSVPISNDGTVATEIKSYSGKYITIPINKISYYLENDTYVPYTEGTYEQSISVDKEKTYRILIRDLSNTKMDTNYSEFATVQYTNYFSSRQTIIVSFDKSEFRISYTDTINGETERIYLESDTFVEETIDGDESKKAKITYLNPINLKKPFDLSFYPTISETDGNRMIQVDTVTIKYYPYVEVHQEKNVTDKDGNLKVVKYYYYELSNSATDITVYSFSENGPIVDLKQEEIRLNTENITTAGKYEITRIYKSDETYSYNPNDYFQRTYVFYVDRNEVVTTAGLVGEGNDSHLESLVGGDIFVSMYDNKNNASLVVTFPDSEFGNSTGSSLYNNGVKIESVLTTNMLPVSVYIPQMKYTKAVVKKVNPNGSYDLSVELNDAMNYYAYNNNVSDQLIQEYALSAEIHKVTGEADGVEIKTLYATTAKRNLTNPSINDLAYNANGFLDFYKTSGEKLSYLQEAGKYYVTIYQGRFGANADTYQQNITFCFDIKASNPDFEVQAITGSSLNSFPEQNGTTGYYTNQANLNLIWEEGSDYMAEIDQTEILFETSKGLKIKAMSENPDGSYSYNDIFTETPKLSNGLWVAQLSLEKLGIYNHNESVKITMQFKNHDDKFYTKVSKTIHIDLSAPNTNIQTLVDNSISGGYILPLTSSALRTYYTAKNEQTTSLENTCYNLSNATGTFAYYSYNVTADYIQTLKSQISTSNEIYNVYYRAFLDAENNNTKYLANIQQETAPADFFASNFTLLKQNSADFKADTYYEIVEMDRAGNMTIYTIYICNYSGSADEDDERNNLFTYATNGEEKFYTISDYNAVKSYSGAIHNIYSKTDFELKDINYFSDAWAQIELATSNTNGHRTPRYMMLTPWDTEYAYVFVENEYTKVLISDLIDGSTSSRYKHIMSIYDRTKKQTETFYFNTRNTSLSATLTTDQNQEYIQFSKPSDQAIQDKTYSSTYLTYLKITADGQLLFEQTNTLGYASLWKNSTDNAVIVTTNNTLGTITFTINPNLGFESNTRIVYEYCDNYNFGDPVKEIHLYKETVIKNEITCVETLQIGTNKYESNYLYAYYDNSGNLIYITKDGFRYSYNKKKYKINVLNLAEVDVSNLEEDIKNGVLKLDEVQTSLLKLDEATSSGVTTTTFYTTRTNLNYNDKFLLVVTSTNEANTQELVKTIYFTLYNELPEANFSDDSNTEGQFKLLDVNGTTITREIIENQGISQIGYYSEVRLQFSQKQESFLQVKYSISTDKLNWTEVSSGSKFKCESDQVEKYYLKVWYDEKSIKDELGTAEYIFGKVPQTQIFEFNLSSLTSTFWIEATIDGETKLVEKSNTIYKSILTGKQYSNHYIINIDYNDKDLVKIKTNSEQKIETSDPILLPNEDSSIKSELYTISNYDNKTSNIPAFSTNIVITYIPPKDDFVKEFYATNYLSGIIEATAAENMINTTSKHVAIPENSSIDQLELRWTKYYGMPNNEIMIKLVKDGIELSPVTYTKEVDGKSYNYIYLTRSGKYSISLYDISGNVHKFNKGSSGQTDVLTFIFLKDVPFTVSYTNPLTGETETTAPIQEAVYNGAVTLKIDEKTRSEFYSLSGYPVISVKKNGVEYTKTFKDNTTYIFSDPGSYEVTFTATSSIADLGKIRQETYKFSIINPDEYRISYIHNSYANYYIEKVIRNDVDITENLVKLLNVGNITINNKTYITQLPLSYADEKTGAGTYVITVNSNDKLYRLSSAKTSWTYVIKIESGTAPIKISVAEGESSTSNIEVSFNQANIYSEMGECTIRILMDNNGTLTNVYTLAIDDTSTGNTTATIEARGTYYVQIIAPSGNLMFSYKVTKNDPLNAAAIIAIVISVIVAIVVIILIIKLRKRITVK